MAIFVNLDVLLAKRKLRSRDLAKQIGITEQNLSILKTGKAKAIRFSTLEAICQVLNCQPGDVLSYHNQKKVTEPTPESHDVEDCGIVVVASR